MSEASDLTPPQPDKPQRRKSGPKLTEDHRRAIVAAVVAGSTQKAVAQQFDVNINTVRALVKSVRENVPESALSSSWRQKLSNELPAKAVNAIEQSVDDKEDVHKAAGTGLTLLKGLGILQGESSTSINVLVNQVNALPDDWREHFVTLDPTPTSSDDLPDNGATEIKSFGINDDSRP